MTKVNPHDVRIRKRELVLSPADELAYAELLAREFPDVRFLDRPWVLPKGENPPKATVRSLAECRCNEVRIVFDPIWRPMWKCDPGSGNSDRWYIGNPIYPNGTFNRSRGVWLAEGSQGLSNGEPLEFLEQRDIYFRIAPNDRAQEVLAAKALRLIGKVASTRNMLTLHLPAMESSGIPRSLEYWFGFDARRWCLEKRNRAIGVVAFRDCAFAFRPAERPERDEISNRRRKS